MTLWGEVLIAVVIDDQAFDQVSGGMIAVDHEGTEVRSMPAVCVALAWEHRDQLLAG